jgi:hypothetical protein
MRSPIIQGIQSLKSASSGLVMGLQRPTTASIISVDRSKKCPKEPKTKRRTNASDAGAPAGEGLVAAGRTRASSRQNALRCLLQPSYQSSFSLSYLDRNAPMTSASPLPTGAQRSRGSKRRSPAVSGVLQIQISAPHFPPPTCTLAICSFSSPAMIPTPEVPRYLRSGPHPFLKTLALCSFLVSAHGEGGGYSFHLAFYT